MRFPSIPGRNHEVRTQDRQFISGIVRERRAARPAAHVPGCSRKGMPHAAARELGSTMLGTRCRGWSGSAAPAQHEATPHAIHEAVSLRLKPSRPARSLVVGMGTSRTCWSACSGTRSLSPEPAYRSPTPTGCEGGTGEPQMYSRHPSQTRSAHYRAESQPRAKKRSGASRVARLLRSASDRGALPAFGIAVQHESTNCRRTADAGSSRVRHDVRLHVLEWCLIQRRLLSSVISTPKSIIHIRRSGLSVYVPLIQGTTTLLL